jgi:hypothetical protein
MPNVSQGNQKVLFAYQLKDSTARVLNPAITLTGEIIVRVEWPAAGASAPINYPTTETIAPLSEDAAVRPVMAIPSVVRKLRWNESALHSSPPANDETSTVTGTKIASRISTWATIHLGYSRQGIDIVIPQGQVWQSNMTNNVLPEAMMLKVLVQFSDGSQDDLWVRIMPPQNCKLSLNEAPPTIDKKFAFSHESVTGSTDEFTGIATYNISKVYVKKPTDLAAYEDASSSETGAGGGASNTAYTWYSFGTKSISNINTVASAYSPTLLDEDVIYTPFLQPWGAFVYSRTQTPWTGTQYSWVEIANAIGEGNPVVQDNIALRYLSGNVGSQDWLTSGSGVSANTNYTRFVETLGSTDQYEDPTVVYATSQHSFLSFVTGQADNTQIYRAGTLPGFLGLPFNGSEPFINFETGYIDLNNFFGISTQCSFNGSVNQPLGEPSWGLKYGWFAWTASAALWPNGQNLTSGMITNMWGVPPVWLRSNAVPFTNSTTGATDQNAFLLGASESTGFGYSIRDSIAGNFYGKLTNHFEVGDYLFPGSSPTQGIYAEKAPLFLNAINSDNAPGYAANTGNLPAFYDRIPPAIHRWARLTGGCRSSMYSSQSAFANDYTTNPENTDAPKVAGFSGLSAINRMYNNSGLGPSGKLKTTVTLSESRSLYQPFGTDTALLPWGFSTNGLSMGGSLRDVRMNIGRNFFYTGGKYHGGDPVVPLFKGIIRTLYVENSNQLPGNDVYDALRWKINNFYYGLSAAENGNAFGGVNSSIGKHPCSYMDYYGVYHALDKGTPELPLVPHSAWDLFASLLYARFTYGNYGIPAAMFGLGEELFGDVAPASVHFPWHSALQIDDAVSGSAIQSFTTGLPMNESESSHLFANDISFLVYGRAPWKEGQDTVVDATYDQRNALVANHPVGSTPSTSTGIPSNSSIDNSDKTIIEGSTPGPFLVNIKGNRYQLSDTDSGGSVSVGGDAVYPYPYLSSPYLGLRMDISATNMSMDESGGNTNVNYGTSGALAITYKLPTYSHYVEVSGTLEAAAIPDTDCIISAGTDSCFKLDTIATTIENRGPGYEVYNELDLGADAGYPITRDFGTFTYDFIGSQGLRIDYIMQYRNTCINGSGEFETAAGSKTTTNIPPNLSTQVSQGLEIFKHIEFSPLSQISLFDANQGQYAYKVVVEDSDDVDALSVSDISGTTYGSNKYQLYLMWTADINDVYSNPDVSDAGLDAEYTDIFPDVNPAGYADYYYGNATGDWGSRRNVPLTNSKWMKGYGTLTADSRPGAAYTGFRGSFITIAYDAGFAEDPTNFNSLISAAEIFGALKQGDRHIIHFPFLNYGQDYLQEGDLDEQIVVGCTDETATNYNPDATQSDNTLCIYCQDLTNQDGVLDFTGTVDDPTPVTGNPLMGIEFGVVGPNSGQGTILDNTLATIDHGTIGILTTNTYLNSNDPVTTNIFNNYTTEKGGIIIANNYQLGQVARFDDITKPIFKVRLKSGTTGNAMNDLLNFLEGAGETESMWRIRIYPLSQAMMDDPDLTWGNPIWNATPSSITDAVSTILYSETATGGDIFSPEWDFTDYNGQSYLNLPNMLTGLPHVVTLSMEPQGGSLDELCIDGTADLSTFVMFTVFWPAVCSCGLAANEYYALAANDLAWNWNTGTNTFPVFNLFNNYSTYNCPNIPSATNFGDGTFIGIADGPESAICYQIDEQLTNCDDYFVSCILEGQLNCIGTSQVPGPPYDIPTLLADGYIEPGLGQDQYVFGYADGYILTQIDGVWDPVTNTYQFVPNLNYTVSVFLDGNIVGPVQNQNDATVVGGQGLGVSVYQNEFQVSEPGTYTVYINVIDIPDTIEADSCIQEFTVSLDATCPDFVIGCTNPSASNYNPDATIDDGTCDDGGCGEEILANEAFVTTISSTNMDSTCELVEVVSGGQTISYEVPVPDTSTGSITVAVDYDSNSPYASDSFAIAIGFPGEQSLYSFIGSDLDSLAVLFQSYPETGGNGVTPIAGIGFWSPLISTSAPTNANGQIEFTFNQSNTGGLIVPGTFTVLVVPNYPNIDSVLSDCTTLSLIQFESLMANTTIVLNPPDEPCTPPCLNPPCEPWVTGCTDPAADNYDPEATLDDGSCEYPETFCEQFPENEDCVDCTSATENLASGGRYKYKSGKVNETICDPTIPSEGECTDPNACNYNPDAPLDASNNLICDYCSCTDPIDDPDCLTGDPCEPAIDPDCIQVPICPDPENPECEPIIENPCPNPGDCEPPPPPCVVLGDCQEIEECLPGEDCGCPEGENCDPYLPDSPVVEVPCTFSGQTGGFSIVQEQAFACMSDEGKRLMFRLKAGSQYEREDIIKLSLISYLFAGGLEASLLDCLFNCNDTMFSESVQKSMVKDCQADWVKAGGRIWNGTDNYVRGSMVMHIRLKQGIMTRSIYIAERNIAANSIQPGFPQSGWKRCYTTRLQTKTNVATGEENYLQTFYEFMTRMCTSCTVQDKPGSATIPDPANLIDPKKLDNYLNPQDNSNGDRLSGILGADGQEIII